MKSSATSLAPVARALSKDRLAPYLQATNGELTSALELYEWNISVSCAIFEDLGIFEIVLRNALSTQLSLLCKSANHTWLDDPYKILAPEAHTDIAVARKRLMRLGRVPTENAVISELTFGFWKYLLAKRYEATLWTPALRHAFPNLHPKTRAEVFKAVDQANSLRNRVAHHETIFGRDLALDTARVNLAMSWVDADVALWASNRSRVPELLATRPY